MVLEHGLLVPRSFMQESISFAKFLQCLKSRTMSSNSKSGHILGAKAATATASSASSLDITSLRKVLTNERLQRYKYI